MAQKSQLYSFKEHVERFSHQIPKAKHYSTTLASVESYAVVLINDVDNRINTERRLNVLIRGASSLIETCNSLMLDAVSSPFFKPVLLTMLFNYLSPL